MARDFYMPHVCGVEMRDAGADIVMLQDPCCVEVVHEALVRVPFGDAFCGPHVGGDLLVCGSSGIEISP